MKTRVEKKREEKSRSAASRGAGRQKASSADAEKTVQLKKKVLINGVLKTVDDDFEPPPPSAGRRVGGVDPGPLTLEERRALLLEAAERRALLAGERGMASKRKKRESKEALERLDPQELFNRIGPRQKWREHIDGKHQAYGEQVYTEGRHGKPPDPEYNSSMMEADRFAATTFGRPLDGRGYHQIHAKASPASASPYFKDPRTEELALRYEKFNDPESVLAREPDDFDLIDSITSPAPGELGYVKLKPPGDGRKLNEILTDHYARIAGIDEGRREKTSSEYEQAKLLAIAKTHKNLENLHQYVDFNTRTNRIVLNRLLAEQNLRPTILDSPLDVHHTTLGNWAKAIRAGQDKWQDEAEGVEDYKRQWEEFDARKREEERMEAMMKKLGF